MRMFLLTWILIFGCTFALAGTSVTKNWTMPSPPPSPNGENLYDYLQFIYQHNNQIQIVTTNPNGNVIGNVGQELLYNNSGTWKSCYQTMSPNGTVWKCTSIS